MNETPNLSDYRWIVVNSSGGKDSQTALRFVVNQCDALSISRDRIVVSHQCLGEAEWKGTSELARQQADFYGLRFEISKQRNREGVEMSLLDKVRARGMWPSSGQRYCTSDMKRTPGHRVVTMLSREAAGDVLYIKGFRAEESPARAKAPVFAKLDKLCTKTRTVMEWLPIHTWTEAQVWADIKASGVPYHSAYALGMPRLSCMFCIFAPKAALMIAGKHNPEMLQKYVDVEREIGHTFQNGRSIESIQQAIAAGEEVPAMNGAWNM
jgi:3'-phosphoadenosine 5'-phosphosulfate sulfotransferase (PAPS reductase)/FAD synthetase